MKLPFEVICLHDHSRPNEIPFSKWVKRGNKYHVIKVEKMMMENGKLAYVLQEIDLSDCFPYTAFAAWRFGIPVDDKIEVEQDELVELLIDDL